MAFPVMTCASQLPDSPPATLRADFFEEADAASCFASELLADNVWPTWSRCIGRVLAVDRIMIYSGSAFSAPYVLFCSRTFAV